MSTEMGGELAAFGQFILQCARSQPNLTPEEAVDLWRMEHPLDEAALDALEAADVEAVRLALEDMDAGVPGIPHEEVMRNLRERFGSSS